MEQSTWDSERGRPYHPDLVQDVEELVQSVKDEIAMKELGSMYIVSDVQESRLVPRIGLQQLRIASEDVDMKDADTESEIESERDNLVRAHREAEHTRDAESKPAIIIQPQQPTKDTPRATDEVKANTTRNGRPRTTRRAEFEAEESAVEEFQPFQGRMNMGEEAVTRHAVSGGHGMIQPPPKFGLRLRKYSGS